MKKILRNPISTNQSILLRYADSVLFDGLNYDDLEALSISEGSQILPLLNYKGVSIYILDETTMMTGGTFKALEAALVIAHCKKRRLKKVAFSSGANNGTCLSIYGQKAGIETFFFHPQSTAWKLDAEVFSHPLSHLISVDQHERKVKEAAKIFAKKSGIAHIPNEEIRYWSSGPRAYFIYEFIKENQIQFDWIGQAICAAFGPISFYNHSTNLMKEEIIVKADIPKFLGIQQDALCPIVTAFKNRHKTLQAEDIKKNDSELFVKNLYNTEPSGSYPHLYNHLLEFGGDMCTVSKSEFDYYLPTIIESLNKIGIEITKIENEGRETIVEKAGLLSLAGTLKAIDSGIVKSEEKILTFLTGGAVRHSGKKAQADFSIEMDDDLEMVIEKYIKGNEL